MPAFGYGDALVGVMGRRCSIIIRFPNAGCVGPILNFASPKAAIGKVATTQGKSGDTTVPHRLASPTRAKRSPLAEAAARIVMVL